MKRRSESIPVRGLLFRAEQRLVEGQAARLAAASGLPIQAGSLPGTLYNAVNDLNSLRQCASDPAAATNGGKLRFVDGTGREMPRLRRLASTRGEGAHPRRRQPRGSSPTLAAAIAA